MHVVDVDAAGEEVRLTAPKLARARPREQEPEPAGLFVEKQLHHVEQRGHPLHFVDEHRPRSRRSRMELPFQPLGMAHVIAKRPGTGQVERKVGPKRGQQRRLAHLPRSENQDAAPGVKQDRGQDSFVHVGKIPGILPTHNRKRRPLLDHLSRFMLNQNPIL